MVDRPPSGAASDTISADLVAHRGFSVSRRGFEQKEVRDFLQLVAATVRSLHERAERLAVARAEAEARVSSPNLDEDTLIRLLGEQTGSILRSARAAATEMRSEAEAESAEMRAAAERETTELRASAESASSEQRARAEADATEMRASAERETTELRGRTEAEVTALRTAAETAATDLRRRAEAEGARIVDEARQEAGELLRRAEGALGQATEESEQVAARIRSAAQESADQLVGRARLEAESLRQQAEHDRKLTVEGAQAVREKILGDLTRRRRVASIQIEQLRAGRERLLESYAVVRRTLEEVNDELHRADSEAREAAAEAGRRHADDDSDVEDLSALLEVPDHEAGPSGDDTTPAGSPVVGGGDAMGGDDAVGATDASPPDEAEHEAVDGVLSEERSPRVRVLSGPSPVAPSRPSTPRPPSHPGRTPGPSRPSSPPSSSRPSPAIEQESDDAPAPGPPAAPAADAPGSGPPAGDAQGSGPAAADAPGSGPPAAGTPVAPAGDAQGSGPATADAPAVDDLFARIRAGRTNAVARAREVLEDTAAGSEPPSEDLEPARSDDEESWLQGRDESLGKIETALTRKLKRALQDEQNDLLDRLRSLRGRPTTANLLPAVDQQRQRFALAATALVEQGAAAGSDFATAVLGRPVPDVGSSPAAVGDLVEELAHGIVDPLRRRLEQTIVDTGDDEQPVLVEALGGAYREWKTQRVERIAGDALTGAFARGVIHATPRGGTVRWVVEDLDGPCPDCDDNVLAGDLVNGEAFPTGQLHPPAHAGCRCIVVPALS